jgi:hypothetical protein
MSAKIFVLVALIALPLSAHAKWASEKTDLKNQDLHVNQLCEGSYAECFDVHHMDENILHIKKEISETQRLESLKGKAQTEKGRQLVKRATLRSKESLKKDRFYLKKLFQASKMTEVKKQIAAQIKTIDAVLGDDVSSSKQVSKMSKAIK